MKALITASVASMIDQFNMNNIRILKDLGYEVHVGCNFNNPGSITKEKCDALKKKLDELEVKYFQIDFSRNVLSLPQHLKALKQLKAILKENNYKLVHCHSPIGGMLTRLAAKNYRKKGTKVIYTAHGFHFYNGAPKKNWLIFYPIEKCCSRWTDLLLTINTEDYELAKHKMKAKSVDYIPGVGVDVDRFSKVVIDKRAKRKEIGVPSDAFMVLSVGELNENKNHKLVIEAISKINDPKYYYVVAGVGKLRNYLEEYAKQLGVNLVLLGFRTDIPELFKCADVFVLPSIREGLNVSVMESIASGCPTIVSRIRGNVDMVPNENCFSPRNTEELVPLLKKKGIKNSNFMDKANSKAVDTKMKNIYQELSV